MLNNLFENRFDFDHNGTLDNLEQRAAFATYLEDLRQYEGIDTPLDELDDTAFSDLAGRSGIDPSEFGI